MRTIWRATVCAALLLAAAGVSAAPPELPLIEAAKTGDRLAASRLLTAGEDPNAALPDGTTALYWAAYRDDHRSSSICCCGAAQLPTPRTDTASSRFRSRPPGATAPSSAGCSRQAPTRTPRCPAARRRWAAPM